ncbi:hypothetical protein BY458DRAFT_519678 [Sporodiniella umbellata]|nr:hypothetical protein BY458DRAFT_519678 [Sporodiniella umbellata]
MSTTTMTPLFQSLIQTDNNNTNATTALSHLVGEQQLQSQPQPPQQQPKQPIPKVTVLHTPPVFFINSKKEERKRPLEPELQRSSSISLNYGERRLSNILSETKPESHGTSALKKKVLVESADPSRGLFGDGNVYKRVKLNERRRKESSQEIPVQSSNSIRVYGFPTHLTTDLRRYYEKFGTVTQCERSLADWITITFESPATALQALKNNNTEIYGHPVRVILKPEPSSVVRHGTITLEESNHLLQQQKEKKSELGQGKEGITALDGQLNDEGIMKPVDNSLLARLKEALFGW